MKPYLMVGARDGKVEQRMVGISEYIVDMRAKELREQKKNAIREMANVGDVLMKKPVKKKKF